MAEEIAEFKRRLAEAVAWCAGDRSYDAYLVSWVPPVMIELAEKGIRANSTDCIVWAEGLEEPFIDQLRAEGILG